MSTVKANNVQVGQSGTATNNFTLYQPSTPDGTVRLAVGNSGATTGDVLSVSNTGLSVTGTLSATGNVTLSGGTANGVLYLNGSKVATTGSALTFNGTALGVGTSTTNTNYLAVGGAVSVSNNYGTALLSVASNSYTGVTLASHENTAGANGTYLGLMRSRGTQASPTNLLSGDLIGSISGQVFNTAGASPYRASCAVDLVADGNQASGDLPGRIVFSTVPAGSITLTERMRIDSSGNLGLGVTPSAWQSGYTVFQARNTAIFTSGTTDLNFGQNVYVNSGGNYTYISNGYATLYNQYTGKHYWSTAASGFGYGTAATSLTSTQNGNSYTIVSAGTTDFTLIGAANNNVGTTFTKSGGTGTGTGTVSQNITFTQAMTLDASGRLGIGLPSPLYMLHINGGSGSRCDVQVTYNALGTSSSNGAQFGIQSGGAYIWNFENSPVYFATNNTERVRIGSGGEVYFPGVGTTASAANAFLNNGSTPANQLLRSTSSLRYKTDVETLDHAKADAVLNLRPVWYRSKAEADRKDWSWYGLIAEEVAQVEPRLVHWSYPEDQFETIETQTEIEKTREVEVTPAVLDDEGNVVEPAVTETETYTETETKSERKLKTDAQLAPDGVQYDRLTVMLLDIVKRQNQRIEQLEAKVAALEAQ